MAEMEWLSKLLSDLDTDERRRLLAVLQAALNSEEEDGHSSVHLLADEVPLWERLEACELAYIQRFVEPEQRDFVDPRYYAAEAWLSDEGVRAVVALVAQALKRLELLVS